MKQETIDFFKSVQRHKALVMQSGLFVGGISDKRLFNHDASKFTVFEFPHYANHFHGDKSDPYGYEMAWQHHLRANDHHWQHWIKDGKPHTMPEICIREMVADWLAAEKQYGGSWDMTGWLNKNLNLDNDAMSEIKMHSESIIVLRSVLAEIGYTFGEYGEIVLSDSAKFPDDI